MPRWYRRGAAYNRQERQDRSTVSGTGAPGQAPHSAKTTKAGRRLCTVGDETHHGNMCGGRGRAGIGHSPGVAARTPAVGGEDRLLVRRADELQRHDAQRPTVVRRRPGGRVALPRMDRVDAADPRGSVAVRSARNAHNNGGGVPTVAGHNVPVPRHPHLGDTQGRTVRDRQRLRPICLQNGDSRDLDFPCDRRRRRMLDGRYGGDQRLANRRRSAKRRRKSTCSTDTLMCRVKPHTLAR